jgi:hypothetical protein
MQTCLPPGHEPRPKQQLQVLGNIRLRRLAATDELRDRLLSGGERLQQAQAHRVTQEPESLGDQVERLSLKRMAGVR